MEFQITIKNLTHHFDVYKDETGYKIVNLSDSKDCDQIEMSSFRELSQAVEQCLDLMGQTQKSQAIVR